MIRPTIHLEDKRWKKALAPYCRTVEGICAAIPSPLRGRVRVGALSVLPVSAPLPASPLKGGGVAIVLADDAFVQNLNKQYRGKNKPTNVLSFPNEDEPLGDVILAYDTVAREAEEQGKTFRDHAAHLIIHGILHLMGYDHEDDKEAEKMEAQEIKILKKLGIANPYL